MKISGLEWDDGNIEHIIRHSVTPPEIEDVSFGRHLAYSGKNDRYILYGQTDGGRYLKVILERRHGNHYRPVTAFDMSNHEKHNYRKRLGI